MLNKKVDIDNSQKNDNENILDEQKSDINTNNNFKETANYIGETFDESEENIVEDNDEDTSVSIITKILRHFGAFFIAGFFFMIFVIILIFASNSLAGNLITTRGVVVVPDLQGSEIINATRILNTLSLKMEVIESEYSELSEGLIISQIPSKGREIYKNRTVQVVTSRGQKIITMPLLRGTSFHDINDILRTHELKLGSVVQHYSTEIPAGFIINSTPSPGEDIMAGKEVNIILSIGRDPLDPLPVNEDIPPLPFFNEFFEENIF